MQTTAERLGISTKALQEWSYAADLADVSNEEFTAGMRILQRNLFGASGSEGKDVAADFKKIGVTVKDSSGNIKDLDTIISESADGFKNLKNPIEKVAIAQKLFGRGGAALIPLLSKGSEGVASLKEEFAALGGALNDETIAAANDADDAFKRLKFGVRGLLMNAMRPFVLIATEVATKVKDAIVWFNNLTKNTQFVTAAIMTLGFVAASVAVGIIAAFWPIIATVLAVAAGIAAIVLVGDDLLVFFHGGKSLIGQFIDKMYGVGTSAKVVEFLKGAWENLTAVIKTAWSEFNGGSKILNVLKATFSELGDMIAFVVDQLSHLDQFKEGVSQIFSDIGNFFTGKKKEHEGSLESLAPYTTLEKAPGSSVSSTAAGDADPNQNARGNIGGFGRSFFGSFSRLPGDYSHVDNAQSQAPSAVTTLPEVTIPGGHGTAVTNNTVNVHVAANARPDPALLHAIKTAATEGVNSRNRNALPAIPGGG